MENSYENTLEFFPGIRHEKLTKKELMKNVSLAQKGDDKAFEKVLKHLYGYISRIPQEFFIQGSQSQDVVQEACIKLLNVVEKYEEKKGSFVSFAQNSIRKHIITMINKETTKKRAVLNSSVSLNDTTKNKEGETIDFIDIISNSVNNRSSGIEPLDIVQKDYEEYIIREISKNLSEMETNVFHLRFINGYSYREIAEELGLTRTTKKGKVVLDCKSVDNSVCRSKPKIKKALKRLNITTDLFEFEIKQLYSKDKEGIKQRRKAKKRKRTGRKMPCRKKK
jgi:RNA polymerase sporulation-specific sigma factor